MEIGIIIILVLCGVIGGFLSGLLGVGGGIIFIPIITFFLHQTGSDLEGEEFVRYLLANSFATIFFAGVISTWKQYKLQSFYPKQIIFTALTAMVSSAIVTYLIAAANWYSKSAFNIIFLALLVFTVLRFIVKKTTEHIEVQEAPLNKFLITGFLTGIVTALSGLGGGIVMIPLFSQYIRLDMKSASAISIGVIPLILIPILTTYLVKEPVYTFGEGQFGYIIPGLFIPMVAGLVFAAPMGVATAQKVSNKLLQFIFAALVIIVIINTIINLV